MTVDLELELDDQGDGPDTLDDRLDDVRRLIDTFGDELDAHRRQLRRVVVLALIDAVLDDVVAIVRAELARVPSS